MAIIKCKMCGGDMELSPDKTFGTCEYCGSTMTLPKVDDDQRAAAFNRGNHFRRIGEFDKALSVYERIVAENDGDAEAHWCCALCRFGIEYVEDPATYEWLPTCHRASFDNFLEDVDYLAALEHSDGITRRQYQKDAAKIAEVQRGILATSQNEEPFDVFICYKESDENGNRTVDSTLAQDIYYQLTEKGYRVFFARITLEDKAGAEYEPYIFAALNSARVMVAVGTKPEHFSAVWVKNEWSRFLALMKKDRSKLLLPCYRDMDPYDLPEQLSVLQSYDMSKIGFIQDLIRGVGKVLDANREKPVEPVRETVAERVVVQQTEGGANLTALLKRGNIALEDGDWNAADGFFDRALDIDPECAEAYLGKALAGSQAKDLDALVKSRAPSAPPRLETLTACGDDTASIDAAADKYAVGTYLSASDIRALFTYTDFTYQSAVAAWEQRLKAEKDYWSSDRLMRRAFNLAKQPLLGNIEHAKDLSVAAMQSGLDSAKQKDQAARETIRREYTKFLEQTEQRAKGLSAKASEKREEEYKAACKAQKEADSRDAFVAAAELFGGIAKKSNYKDVAERAQACRNRAAEIEAEEHARIEAERKREAKRGLTVGLVAILVVAIGISGTLLTQNVIIPAVRYQQAEKLVENAQYDDAIAVYLSLGDYRDSEARISDTKNRSAYAEAEALRDAGEYDKAISAFTELGDFADSKGQIYSLAETMLGNGNVVAAAVVFEKIGDYLDAKERSHVLWDSIAGCKTVMAGLSHTVGLRSNGTVVVVGDNSYGQCDTSNWTDIVSVAAGRHHTVGLRSDSTVIAVGNNSDGQCNMSDWTDIVAVAAGSYHTVGLRADGTVVTAGKNRYGDCATSEWTDIVSVAAGNNHTVGLHSDGTVIAVGKREGGRRDVSNWDNIIAVAAGSYHTVGLRSDGTVVAAGYNGNGQCDTSNWTDIVAVASGESHTVGLRSDGTVVAVGNNLEGQCNTSNWTNIVAVAAGSYHTLGLRSDGTVVAVGNNQFGQCSVDDWTDIKIPETTK